MKKLMEKFVNGIDLEAFFRDNKEMIIKVAAVALAIVAAFFVFAASSGNSEPVNNDDIVSENTISEPVSSSIYVDIGGEVKNPMLAELPEGSRVDDAIKAAGGLTDKADLTDINRAAFVEDGEKIYIPALIEMDESSSDVDHSDIVSGNGLSAQYSDGKVNINIADSEELQKLTGVGPVTAQKIIDYRKENGRFAAIEDIKNVTGIGDKTFEKFKDDIKV